MTDLSCVSSRHESGPWGQYLADPYLPSIADSSVASSARFAASFGAGAGTLSLSSSIARFDAGVIGWPSKDLASSTALLNAASQRSVARALSSSVSTLMYVACV